MTKQQTILVIDGDGLLTRAHYGAGHEYMYEGYEVGGVYTSIKKIRQQIDAWDADALVVAFDPTGSKTFRHEKYFEYKQGRPPKPLGLIQTKVHLIKAMELMGATVVHANNVEADDLLATYAKLAGEAGWRAVVSTHDKDCFVLAEHSHVVVAPPFSYEPMTPLLIKEKFGVEPCQITDYLALLGDAADNIPGVDLCGPKKAEQYLTQYNTLEAIVEAAHKLEINNKLGENFRIQGKRAIAFRDLMTLVDNINDVPPISLCGFKTPDHEKLVPFLEKLGFYDLASEAKSELSDVSYSP